MDLIAVKSKDSIATAKNDDWFNNLTVGVKMLF
jgi:hypothetical protein